jgi:hypothetical protein
MFQNFMIVGCVEPLLCNDRKMGRYTIPVSRQRLGKHVPVARQQILNNATDYEYKKWKRHVSVRSVLRTRDVS